MMHPDSQRNLFPGKDDTLLEVQPCLSPRLAWLKKHNVFTERLGNQNHLNFSEWVAYVGKMPATEDEGVWGSGDTEDAAIVSIAKCCGWKLWNEEEAHHG